ncbi:hypothetical protein BCR41DRAFT_373784 [Lobosporangium transversale]|uniref:Uncharacterized protein n=1 Tax=Lobosporangium transversale TaxID=64571 RepID=A0A1Y2GCJ2_9FUNG|nr:hypothetical protein BCR41DRAFT_373784 [Lobosporangium transversale]ORZ07009.1 hypothetical protein BCR41DRAFT_373784 [Lobosporangium transversale]|eukprot:XP_021877805.1 hypothetical protein BCR41DRAFT_373784 [Lobosporangium transversale]
MFAKAGLEPEDYAEEEEEEEAKRRHEDDQVEVKVEEEIGKVGGEVMSSYGDKTKQKGGSIQEGYSSIIISKLLESFLEYLKFECMEFPGWVGYESVSTYITNLKGLLKDEAAKTRLDELLPSQAVELMFKSMEQADSPQAQGRGWEPMMIGVFMDVFQSGSENKNLCNWDHSPTIRSMCEELDGDTEIVGLRDNGNQGITHEHISMKDFMSAHVNNNSRHEDMTVPPFYFPSNMPSGPDIVFYIRIQEKIFPVFMQLKLRHALMTFEANKAVDTVSEKSIKTHVGNSRITALVIFL